MKKIEGPASSGKTTQALEELIANGGGYFFTTNLQEVTGIAKTRELLNGDVQVIVLPMYTRIVIDGDDEFDITITKRTRK